MNDKDGITRTVLDYVEGWYQGDAKRMDQALSKHLAKRRIASDEEIIDLSKEWMLTETENGRGRIENPEQGRKDITILAQTETMASVLLLSEDFVDYLHLAKVGIPGELRMFSGTISRNKELLCGIAKNGKIMGSHQDNCKTERAKLTGLQKL